MSPVDCVAFILVRAGLLLVERRARSKPSDPGALSIPGGHVEPGETAEQALTRELLEELGIKPCHYRYLCTFSQQSCELQRVHYFIVDSWTGTIENHEADALLWVPVNRTDLLTLEIDKHAISEYSKSTGTRREPPE